MTGSTCLNSATANEPMPVRSVVLVIVDFREPRESLALVMLLAGTYTGNRRQPRRLGLDRGGYPGPVTPPVGARQVRGGASSSTEQGPGHRSR